jgi:hypothetical protein
LWQWVMQMTISNKTWMITWQKWRNSQQTNRRWKTSWWTRRAGFWRRWSVGSWRIRSSGYSYYICNNELGMDCARSCLRRHSTSCWALQFLRLRCSLRPHARSLWPGVSAARRMKILQGTSRRCTLTPSKPASTVTSRALSATSEK